MYYIILQWPSPISRTWWPRARIFPWTRARTDLISPLKSLSGSNEKSTSWVRNSFTRIELESFSRTWPVWCCCSLCPMGYGSCMAQENRVLRTQQGIDTLTRLHIRSVGTTIHWTIPPSKHWSSISRHKQMSLALTLFDSLRQAEENRMWNDNMEYLLDRLCYGDDLNWKVFA